MKKQRTILLFCLILAGGTLTAFQSVSRAELRDQKLKERLENYRKVSFEKCWEVIYEDAADIVDSLMIERARSKRDTIGKPPRPDRPDKPEIVAPSDSTAVAPLVNPAIDTSGEE